MGIYSGFKYAQALYGATTSMSSISPDSGPSTGGVDFIIEGLGLDPRQWDDTFEAGVLNPALWSNISAGTGSVSTGASHLQLSTGAGAGSVGGIESKLTWGDAQGEIRINLPIISSNPAGNVIPIAFSLRVDANNYAIMYVVLNSSGVYTLNCEVYTNGTLVDSFSKTWTRGASVFKILRWDNDVYFIANGVVEFVCKRFVTTAANFRIYADNQAETYDATCTVIWFYWRTFVAFDDQIVHAPTVVSDSRLRGLTPPSIDSRDQEAAYVGLVDLSIVGATAVTYVDAYEYVYVERLRVLNSTQFDMKLSVINDDQLITEETAKKGL